MSLSKGKTTTFVSVNMPYNDLFLQSIVRIGNLNGLEPKPMATYALAEFFVFLLLPML